MSKTRIILADDHGLLRETLATCLEAQPDMQVVAQVPNADEALVEALKHSPDVVLLDIDMAGLICFEAARRIKARRPDTRVLFLSGLLHDRYIAQALEVGASGYVYKGNPPATVVSAIRQVTRGAAYFSPEVEARLVITPNGPALADARSTRVSQLSARELEVLRYVARGLSNKEVASKMGIAARTVDRHIARIMERVGIHSRVVLTRYAVREGLVEPDSSAT